MATPPSADARGLTQPELESLFTRMERPLYNVVYRRLWDAAESRDVVQEAFLGLWKARAQVRRESVEPLLYRAALNLASKRRRSHRLWRWVGLESAEGRSAGSRGADEALAEGERTLAVRRAIEALPEKLAKVILLTELSGMSYTDVGAALGIPEGTVASRRHLAMGRLRESLGALAEVGT